MFSIIALSIILSAQFNLPDTAPDTLDNGMLRVVVTPITSRARAGSLLELYDYTTGQNLTGDKQFAGIQTGSFMPSNGSITCYGDTCAIFECINMIDLSTQETIPVNLTITYTLAGRGLEIIISAIASENVELTSPLEVDFYVDNYEYAIFGNQTAQEERIVDIHGFDGVYRISGDQIVTISGGYPLPDLMWIFPNPSKAIFALNAAPDYDIDSYLSLRLYDVEPPRENCLGPNLCSIMPRDSGGTFFAACVIGNSETAAFISAHPDGFERTASWIMDEIPFIHPDQGDLWGFSTTSSGGERVSAQMIQLLDEHPAMKYNWLILPDGILTTNRDSVWFEPGWEESWSHWHCTWRISTLAPPEYLDWLLGIQEDLYPWADRVNMGSHGYHHTPNADSSFGEFHEFITYEQLEHMERFRMAMLDIDAMELDTNMVRVIRYPGHRTSLSGLRATIAHGFEFYCNGVRWPDYMGGERFIDQYISRYETPEGRLWGTNTVWWGDYNSMYPYEYLSTVLERGKHCLLGSHPISMLEPSLYPLPYDRMDSICTSMEQDYPNFGWLFPIEYGEFLETCWNIDVTAIHLLDNFIEMNFSGATPAGQTAVVLLPDSVINPVVTLDGYIADWELRPGGRIFIDISGLAEGSHSLQVNWSPTAIEQNACFPVDLLTLTAPNPLSGSVLTVCVEGLPSGAGELSISLYDLTGRLMLKKFFETGSESSLYMDFTMSGEVGIIPPGVYILVAECGNHFNTLRIVKTVR